MTRKTVNVAAINLTSLMDIFTVLVFFLLLNMGDGVESFVNMGGQVDLPQQAETLDAVSSDSQLVTITNDYVMLNDKRFENIDSMLSDVNKDSVILRSVTVKAHDEIEFDFIKERLDQLVASGVTNVALLTTQSD